MAAFTPVPDAKGTYRVTVGTTAVNVPLPTRPDVVRIFNATTSDIVFIEVGATAVIPVAGGATGSLPLAGGAGSIPILLGKGNATSISLIAQSAGADVYISLGHGDTVG